MAGSPCPRAKPARSISQAADVFTRAVRLREARRPRRRCATRASSAANAVGVEHRVGEERARGDGVGIGRVDDHALAAAQREHGLAHVGERRASRPRRPRAPAPARRSGSASSGPARGSVEGHGEHDPAPGVALERARAVGEAALRGRRSRAPRERAGRTRAPRRSSRRPPGRTRRRSGSASRRPSRGCRTGTRARPAPRRRSGRRTGPTARPPRPSSRRRPSARRARRSAATVPGKPASATTRLEPPASDQQRLAGRVGVAHGGDDRRLVGAPRRSGAAGRRGAAS